jgi:hypothetical protein
MASISSLGADPSLQVARVKCKCQIKRRASKRGIDNFQKSSHLNRGGHKWHLVHVACMQ